MQGYYGRDHAFFFEYHEETRRLEDFERWLERWVLEVPDRREYMNRRGAARIADLTVKEHAFSIPVDYGY